MNKKSIIYFFLFSCSITFLTAGIPLGRVVTGPQELRGKWAIMIGPLNKLYNLNSLKDVLEKPNSLWDLPQMQYYIEWCIHVTCNPAVIRYHTSSRLHDREYLSILLSHTSFYNDPIYYVEIKENYLDTRSIGAFVHASWLKML